MCRACKAKDQTITVLAEQVEWLRMQLGTPYLGRADSPDNREIHPAVAVGDMPYVSDEEEDIRHMLKQGLIPEDAARAALEQIGAFSTDVTVE